VTGGAEQVLRVVEEPGSESSNGASPSVLIPFSEIKPVAIKWAWRDRIALGKITGLAGRPKIGKGLLYSRVIADVTRGKLDGDLNGPRDAILVTTEDDPGDTLTPRLMAANADIKRVHLFQMGTRDEPVPFRIPQDADELRRRITEIDAAMTVVDPLVEFVDGKFDSHKSQQVRQALASLNAIARQVGCAIFVVIHLNKGASTDPLLRHEGSAAFTQIIRGAMLLGHDPNDPEGEAGSQRVLATTSSNLAKLAPSLVYQIKPVTVHDWTGAPITTAGITHVGESDATGQDLLKQTVDGDGEQSAMAEAEEFLRAELAPGPKLAKAVQGAARDVGISGETLKRAKRNLGVEVAKDGFQGPWKWYLNPVDQRGSSNDDHLCKSEHDHLCENPVETGDSGVEAPKGGQANMDDHVWSKSVDFERSSDSCAGRNESAGEMPF
jgi:putative DNA primase/helicase